MLSLVDAQAAAQDKLNERTLAAARRALQGFDGWYSDRLVAQLAAEVQAVVDAGQRSTAALTDAYLSRIATAIAETRIGPAGVIGDYPLRGVDDAYERLGVEYRYAESVGKSSTLAGEMVAIRLGQMIASDLTLAFTRQSQRFMVAKSVDGYRRIIHPERSRSGTCGLCAVAADRVYGRKSLLPVHRLCRCTVAPIINGRDPAGVLNLTNDQLGGLYDEAVSTQGADLKRIRYRIEEHSELGPQLVAA